MTRWIGVFLEYMMGRVGMCHKWVACMKACVFGGNMSILVNGSPTEEICIKRGLKQGDSLAPFLFLLVAEGFSGLMRNAMSLNLFQGFEVGNNGLVVLHLQYADDTLCIGKATVGNLWTMKALLQGFEMASGLKINFSKSSLIRVNVPPEFMTMACDFLKCSEGAIPFKYLGLPVGASSRKMFAWDPLLNLLSRKLNMWGHRYISFGGRIVLLNSVLNSIPIFYLSFLKMPTKVWRRIVRVQREFLWGGVEGGRKISWVKWKSVCQQKRNGGLGVKDVRVVNVNLLAKWRWRLLVGDKALWKDVLKEKYGACVENMMGGGPCVIPNNASLWWKDIARLDDFGGHGWFSSELSKRVGNDLHTSFWKVRWRGETTFKIKYPRLFSISNQKEATIGDLLALNCSNLEWNFNWRRSFFVWEGQLLANLLEDLEGVVWSQEEDEWRWNLEDNGVFSMKSAYGKLEGLMLSEGLWREEEKGGSIRCGRVRPPRKW